MINEIQKTQYNNHSHRLEILALHNYKANLLTSKYNYADKTRSYIKSIIYDLRILLPEKY